MRATPMRAMVNVKGESKTILGAFVARMKSCHVRTFTREGGRQKAARRDSKIESNPYITAALAAAYAGSTRRA
jgi:hypothetical protein